MTRGTREDPSESPPSADRVPETSAERIWLEQLEAAYRPPPMTVARRARLDARVRERLEHEPRRAWLVPVSAVAVATLGMLLWSTFLDLRSGAPPQRDGAADIGSGIALDERALDEAGWEQRLFYGDLVGTALDEAEPDDALPAEYAAIDILFFDG